MKLLYLILTHAEAADAALSANMETLINRLRAADVSVVTSIGPDDPAVGVEMRQPSLIPSTLPIPPQPPQPPAELNTAALGFGAPSTAAVGQLPIAPVTLPTPPVASALPVPPIASAVVAPTASVVPTNPASTGIEIDAEGLPWDNRIHSGAKTKTEAGLWRSRKNLNDKAMVARVIAELRAAMQAVPGHVAPAPTVAPQVFQQQVQQAQQVAVAAPVMPTPPVTAPVVPVTAPPVAPMVSQPVGDTPQSVMMLLAPHMANGLLTAERQDAVFRQFGIDGLPGLMVRPDLAGQIKDNFVSWIAHWQAGGTQLPGA